ncbi:MAG: ABC transporter substrate-binding protein [Eubacteriales bacterium]
MQRLHNSRIIPAALIICAMLLSLAGCSNASPVTADTTTAKPSERTPVRISALKGPTGMGLVNLMLDQDTGATQNDYSFSLSGTPDDIVAQLSSGEVDIAALPTNLAAVLYQKTSQSIKVLAINTLGVLYILEKGDTIHSLSDLSGRELLATGQGSVPEYVLNELLSKSHLSEPVQITYKAEHAELATLAAAGKADLVMLPEPFVTTVLSKNPDYRIALDLTSEWQKIHKDVSKSELAMGCIVVTKAFAEAHPDAVKSFLAEYKTSTERVNADPKAAGKLVVQYQIMSDASLAEKAIPNCHIVMIQGVQMQSILEPFFQILLDANPKSVGGKVPDSNFYWIP